MADETPFGSLWESALPLLALGGGLWAGARNPNVGPTMFNQANAAMNWQRLNEYNKQTERQREIDNNMQLLKMAGDTGDLTMGLYAIKQLQPLGYNIPAQDWLSGRKAEFDLGDQIRREMLGMPTEPPGAAAVSPSPMRQAAASVPAATMGQAPQMAAAPAPPMSGMDLSGLYQQIHEADAASAPGAPNRDAAINRGLELSQQLPNVTVPPYPQVQDEIAARQAQAPLLYRQAEAQPPSTVPAPSTGPSLPPAPTAPPDDVPPARMRPVRPFGATVPFKSRQGQGTLNFSGNEAIQSNTAETNRVLTAVERNINQVVKDYQTDPGLVLDETSPILHRKQIDDWLRQHNVVNLDEKQTERLDKAHQKLSDTVGNILLRSDDYTKDVAGRQRAAQRAFELTGMYPTWAGEELKKQFTIKDVENYVPPMLGMEIEAARRHRALTERGIQEKEKETEATTRGRLRSEKQVEAEITVPAIAATMQAGIRAVEFMTKDAGLTDVTLANIDAWLGPYAQTPQGAAVATYENLRETYKPLFARGWLGQVGNLTPDEQKTAKEGLPPFSLMVLNPAESNYRISVIEKGMQTALRDPEFKLLRVPERGQTSSSSTTPSATPNLDALAEAERRLQQRRDQ